MYFAACYVGAFCWFSLYEFLVENQRIWYLLVATCSRIVLLKIDSQITWHSWSRKSHKEFKSSNIQINMHIQKIWHNRHLFKFHAWSILSVYFNMELILFQGFLSTVLNILKGCMTSGQNISGTKIKIKSFPDYSIIVQIEIHKHFWCLQP